MLRRKCNLSSFFLISILHMDILLFGENRLLKFNCPYKYFYVQFGGNLLSKIAYYILWFAIRTRRHYMSRLMTKPAKWLFAQRKLRSAWAVRSKGSSGPKLSSCGQPRSTNDNFKYVFPNEPRGDKTNKVSVRPAKTRISMGIRSESSLFAWRNIGSLTTHWAHSEDSDQTGRMPRLIWIFAGRTLTLLVLSCRGSFGRTYLKLSFVERGH